MNLLRKFSVAMTALVIAGFATNAQADWNRKISDIRIVHPPGTPPGTWRVEATIEILNDGLVPNLDLSLDALLSLNGMPLTAFPVQISGRLSICGGCGSCTMFMNGQPQSGMCHTGAPLGGCWCGFSFIEVFDLGATSTDLVRVSIVPSVGSIPELDTSDDTLDMVVGENNPGTLTCAGDGTGLACPCANSGTTGHGCANSSNPNGADLSATGFTEASALTGTDSVVLHVSGMPSGAPLLYFQGTSNAVVVPFGDGVLCTTGSLIRLRVKINVGGASRFPEPGDPSLSSAGGVTLGSAQTLYYQAYYRDGAVFCTSATFNTTNGISLTWY